MCSSNQPNIVWNDGQLNGIKSYRIIQDTKFEAQSTLKFTAKGDNYGKTDKVTIIVRVMSYE